MKLYPITLGIAQNMRGAKIYEEPGEASALSPEVRQQVFKKDDHTCRYCGFKSKKYQDVVFADGDVSNIHLDNLLTSCIYCHQCFDLGKVADMRSGVLVWLPEVEQADLHHIARAIYVSRISQGTMAETAKSALEKIMQRREEAIARLHTDDPYLLSIVMKDFLGPKQYAIRDKKLEGIRLFPLDRRIIKEGDLEFNQFPQILAYWRSKDGPFGGKAPTQWKNFYAQLSNELSGAA